MADIKTIVKRAWLLGLAVVFLLPSSTILQFMLNESAMRSGPKGAILVSSIALFLNPETYLSVPIPLFHQYLGRVSLISRARAWRKASEDSSNWWSKEDCIAFSLEDYSRSIKLDPSDGLAIKERAELFESIGNKENSENDRDLLAKPGHPVESLFTVYPF